MPRPSNRRTKQLKKNTGTLTVLSNGGSLEQGGTVNSLEGRDTTEGELGEELGLLGLGHVNDDLLDGGAREGGDSLNPLDSPVV